MGQSSFYKYDGLIWFLRDPSTLLRGDGPRAKLLAIDQWDDGLPKIGSAYGIPCDHLGHALKVPRLPKAPEVKPKSVWDTQVGGDHYTKMKIQPFQFSMANKLDPMQHTIIKYVTRFRDKNGIQDLEKAKQTIDLLIAYEKEQQCN